MKFVRDILLFDVETTGPDPDKDNVIQLAGVLLDRENLLERMVFNSYVRVSMLEGTIQQHADQLGIPFPILQKSPKIYDVIKKFDAEFGSNALLATHTVSAVLFLRNGFRKTNLAFAYDRHVIDIWTLGYIYTLRYGIKKLPTLNTFSDHFSLKKTNPHNALERARLAGEVFRRIVKEA